MKKSYFIVVIWLLIFVVGCDKTTETTTTTTQEFNIVLENSDGTVIETLTAFGSDQAITLPYHEEEDKIFVGWSDGNSVFYPNYTPYDDITLTAVYELASEVFEYDVYKNEVVIKGYNGNAKYLRIPSTIDESFVVSIATKAFYQLDIIEVEIPNTVTSVQTFAFSECDDLKKVSFNGEFFGEKTDLIHAQNFDQLIFDNSETCIIENTESDSAWTYQEGCPIKEVIGISEVIVINGIEFFSYQIVYDLKYYDNYFLSLTIYDRAFSYLPELVSVEFNSRFARFSGYMFEETPNVNEVIFPEDNETYAVVDNVIYSKDLTELYFHPNIESVNNFSIPETVTRVHPFAFFQNTYIEVINVGDNVEFINDFAFAQAYGLEEIRVSNNNSKYLSFDGVLFRSADLQSLVLVSYPLGKTESSYAIPFGVIYISNSAFAYNKNLEEVTLNNGLISIGDQAFMYTENIKIMDIPATVDRIGYFAFGRSGIEVVIIRRSVVTEGSCTININFANMGSEMEIYVPDDSFDDYYNNLSWSNYKDFLIRMSEYPGE